MPLHLQSRSRRVARIGLAVTLLLIAAAVAASTSELPVRGVSIMIGFVVAGLLIASARSGVKVDATGVRVLRMTKTQTFAWEEISHFTVGDHRGSTGEKVKRPLLVLRSGRTVPLPALEDFDPIGTAPLKGVATRVDLLESIRLSRRS